MTEMETASIKSKLLKVIPVLILAALTFHIVYLQAGLPESDYEIHMNYAPVLDLGEGTNVLWHVLVLGVYKLLLLFPGSGNEKLRIACAGVTALVNLSIYWVMLRQLKSKKAGYAHLIAFVLCICSAVYLPWYNDRIYVGQGSPVTWHNPTNMMVKPFAILAFMQIVWILERMKENEKVPRKAYFCLAGMLLAGMFAKPSFIQGIIPGLGLYLLYCLFKSRGKQFVPAFVLCCCFIPAVLLMLVQYVVAFHVDEAGEGLAFGWMYVSSAPNDYISLLLTICFPLTYLVLFLDRARKSTALQLAWVYWGASWLESAVLYERGERMFDGNFDWAALVAETILFLVTAMELFSDTAGRKKKLQPREIAALTAFGLHFISGCIYAAQLAVLYNGWWY